jgi:hypothetical protein
MLPIPGTSSIEDLEQNVSAASLRFTKEEFEPLPAVTELAVSHCLQLGVSGLTRAYSRIRVKSPHPILYEDLPIITSKDVMLCTTSQLMIIY